MAAPDWLYFVTPISPLVGVVLGSWLSKRQAEETNRDNWRRDALMELHTDIHKALGNRTYSNTDRDCIPALYRDLFPLYNRARTLKSQTESILDEMLEKVSASAEEFASDPDGTLDLFLPQLMMDQKFITESMQDELGLDDVDQEKNERRNNAIKERWMNEGEEVD